MIISALAWMSQYSASIHYSEFLTSALIAHLHFVNDNWLKRSNKKGETKLENSRLFNNSKENKQHRLLQRDRGCCLVEEGILNLWSMWHTCNKPDQTEKNVLRHNSVNIQPLCIHQIAARLLSQRRLWGSKVQQSANPSSFCE